MLHLIGIYSLCDGILKWFDEKTTVSFWKTLQLLSFFATISVAFRVNIVEIVKTEKTEKTEKFEFFIQK